MRLCYVDESGKAETLTRADDGQQPAIVVAGISLPAGQLAGLTHDWIALKDRFRSRSTRPLDERSRLDGILAEVKGTTLRRGFRLTGTSRQRKHAIGLLDGTVGLLERHDCRIVGCVWIKRLDRPVSGMGLHVGSLRFICSALHAGLDDDERAMVVVDSQTHRHNRRLAHAVFARRFARPARHERLVDLPVFGHSENHAGLQIADLLCSALLAPIACAVYCDRYAAWNRHCDAGFLDVRARYGRRLERLVYRWDDASSGADRTSVAVHGLDATQSDRLMWGDRARDTVEAPCSLHSTA